MNDMTLEAIIQQNCIRLLSHKEFGCKFITKEDNLAHRDGKTSAVLLKKILIDRLYDINSYEYKGQTYKFSASNISRAVDDLDYRDWETDRKSTRLNSSHRSLSRMPSSA